MQNQYNVWCKWHPLKTVMLGTTYYPEFYSNIKNNKIKSALQRIAHETHEDLEYYEKVLKDFGCKVIRPTINSSNLEELMEKHKLIGIPRAPLQPRDAQLVVGNNLYVTNFDHSSIIEKLEEYNSENLYNTQDEFILKNGKTKDFLRAGLIEVYKKIPKEKDFPTLDQFLLETITEKQYKKYKRKIEFVLSYIKNSKSFRNNLSSACITVVGKDIYADMPIIDKTFFSNIEYINKNFRINILDIGGHSDGCFHTINNKAILSILDVQNYQTTFPGWDICYLSNESWNKVHDFIKMKEKVKGSWWVPGEEDNDEFTEFVQTWLDDWVGYVEESVFDVNVLVLDEKHVCVNNMNPIVVDFLKKHGMEAVHVPWRHRYFWDGGLHCITLDLYREGVQEDYFPDRKGPVTDDL